MQELLKLQMPSGLPYVLVSWAGCDASRDTWKPLDNLTNSEEAIATFERASGPHALPHRRRLLLPPRQSLGSLNHQGCAACAPRRSPRGARGADAALLVAGQRVAARYSQTPLHVRRLLARGRLHTADVGAVRHRRHTP